MTSDQHNERQQALKRQLVCICKGVNLQTILKALPHCETVEDVNRMAQTGDGGCNATRCGPKIKALLSKFREREQKKKSSAAGASR